MYLRKIHKIYNRFNIVELIIEHNKNFTIIFNISYYNYFKYYYYSIQSYILYIVFIYKLLRHYNIMIYY